jgi:hypothetical protein
MIAVNIAEGDEVFLRASLVVGLLGDPAAGADEGDVQFAVRGRAWLANGEPLKRRAGCDSGDCGEKSPAS